MCCDCVAGDVVGVKAPTRDGDRQTPCVCIPVALLALTRSIAASSSCFCRCAQRQMSGAVLLVCGCMQQEARDGRSGILCAGTQAQCRASVGDANTPRRYNGVGLQSVHGGLQKPSAGLAAQPLFHQPADGLAQGTMHPACNPSVAKIAPVMPSRPLTPAGRSVLAQFPSCRTGAALAHLDAGVLADHACATAGRIQQHAVNCVATNHPRQLPAIIVGQDCTHGHQTQDTDSAGGPDRGWCWGQVCAGICSRAAGWNS